MIYKTKGIVLHHIKYGDSGIIVYMYTRELGRQTFMIQGVRKKKATTKINMFQPLYQLDLDAYYKPGNTMHRLKEVKNSTPYISISNNIYKNSIVLFLAEILYKSLQTEEPNYPLFDFIGDSLMTLDKTEIGFSNFHLLFLLRLSDFLGFHPNTSEMKELNYFDLREGVFSTFRPEHPFYMDPRQSKILTDLINLDFGSLAAYKLSYADRNIFLEHMLDYYQLHELNLTPIKSFKILKEIFHS
ncbi:MAG: DNA repair protein RecO [Bacteroidales bacterium]|nr:DNA repair protein RecO [Bacteroidales bacterium]